MIVLCCAWIGSLWYWNHIFVSNSIVFILYVVADPTSGVCNLYKTVCGDGTKRTSMVEFEVQIQTGDVDGGDGGGRIVLKKGPWTSSEDAILVEYVNTNGEGNWNAVQKNSGLLRCGKSCRLRWANHLRPNLRKGAFSEEEERQIIEMHARMGNKWARMALELEGRTDNEIKNFWNTRIKRLQRIGMPIYPEDVQQQVLKESKLGMFLDGTKMHSHDCLHTDDFEIPEVEFQNLDLDQRLLTFSPYLLDNNLPIKEGDVDTSSIYGLKLPTVTLFPSMDENVSNAIVSLNQYGHNNVSNENDPFLLTNAFPNSCDDLYSNSLSSRPAEMELPSFQNTETQQESWDFVDTFILSSPSEDFPSPRSSGLLEAILYPPKTIKTSNGDPKLNLEGTEQCETHSTIPSGHNDESELDYLKTVEYVLKKAKPDECNTVLDYWFNKKKSIPRDPIDALLGDDFI